MLHYRPKCQHIEEATGSWMRAIIALCSVKQRHRIQRQVIEVPRGVRHLAPGGCWNLKVWTLKPPTRNKAGGMKLLLGCLLTASGSLAFSTSHWLHSCGGESEWVSEWERDPQEGNLLVPCDGQLSRIPERFQGRSPSSSLATSP